MISAVAACACFLKLFLMALRGTGQKLMLPLQLGLFLVAQGSLTLLQTLLDILNLRAQSIQLRLRRRELGLHLRRRGFAFGRHGQSLLEI